MNTTVLYAELIVVGSGAAISIVLFFYSFFGDKSWLVNLKDLSSIGSIVSLIPTLSVIYLLGIIISNLGHLLFESKFFLGLVKPGNITGEKRKEIRNHLYISNEAKDLKDLIEDVEFRQSKIRICRGWFINSLLIIVALLVCLNKGKIDSSMFWFFTVFMLVLVILTFVSWFIALKTQIDVLKAYEDLRMKENDSLASSPIVSPPHS